MELSFFRVASRTICLQDKVIKSHRQHDVISLQKVLRLGVFSSAVCVLNDSTYLYYLRNETFIFEYQNVLGYTITASEFCKMFQASVLRDNVKKNLVLRWWSKLRLRCHLAANSLYCSYYIAGGSTLQHCHIMTCQISQLVFYLLLFIYRW